MVCVLSWGEHLHRSSHWCLSFCRWKEHLSERWEDSCQRESVCPAFICSFFSSWTTSLHLTGTECIIVLHHVFIYIYACSSWISLYHMVLLASYLFLTFQSHNAFIWSFDVWFGFITLRFKAIFLVLQGQLRHVFTWKWRNKEPDLETLFLNDWIWSNYSVLVILGP